MTNLIELARMDQILKAIEKMHNGLLALIHEHQELEAALDARIKKLEELAQKKDG